MDKITRALFGVEDNAARIEGVDRSIRTLISTRTAVSVRTGNTSSGVTTFGEVSSDHPIAVIVAYDGASCSLKHGDVTLTTGGSPMFAVTSASGELTLSAAVSNARAIVFGAS